MSRAVAGGETPIDRLGLPSLLWGKLTDMGIHTIEDLLKEDPGELHRKTGSTISIASVKNLLSAFWRKGMIHPEFDE